MKITFVCDSKIPIATYDDKERILWWLGKTLAQAGHQITFLVKKGSTCPFANVLIINEKKPLADQIPADADFVHFHGEPLPNIGKPYLATYHENATVARTFDSNTVFLSAKHAQLHGGSVFVHPGIDFAEYGEPFFSNKRLYFHFLGNAAWRSKNVRGAMDLAAGAGARLHVIGGSRVNFRKGLRITLSPKVRFHGTLSPDGRNALLHASQGLILPVIWHEPFSLAVAESLYLGCPVFGTPLGALPEMLGRESLGVRKTANGQGTVDAFYADFGCLSTKKSELLEAIKNAGSYDKAQCHEYARAQFSATRMADDYLRLYEKVLDGQALHAAPPTVSDPPGEKFLTMKA
jgi:glycosyltransferase involved in cell wall biosynthesis